MNPIGSALIVKMLLSWFEPFFEVISGEETFSMRGHDN